MAPQSPVFKILLEFSRQYDALFANIVTELNRQITSVKTDAELLAMIDEAFKKYKVDKRLKDMFLNGIVKSTDAGLITLTIASTADYKARILYNPAGVNLSSSINDLTRRDQIFKTLKLAMRQREAWRTTAQKLSDMNIQAGDVGKYITELDRQARRSFAIAGDPDAAKAIRAQLARANRQIGTLVNPSTSKLKRAYKDVIEAVESGSDKALDKAVDYAVRFKQRYNAERIVRTEMSRAYGQSVMAEVLGDPDTVGYKSILSSAHRIHDICDFYASSDLYGMGKGCYPKDHGPPYPYHPHCTCILMPIYEAEGDNSDHTGDDTPDSRGAVSYLRKLPEGQKAMLLGNEGLAAFKEDPHSWPQYLKNYQPQERKQSLLPKSVLQNR